MSRSGEEREDLRQRNRRVGLAVVGFMLLLYALSVAGVVFLN